MSSGDGRVSAGKSGVGGGKGQVKDKGFLITPIKASLIHYVDLILRFQLLQGVLVHPASSAPDVKCRARKIVMDRGEFEAETDWTDHVSPLPRSDVQNCANAKTGDNVTGTVVSAGVPPASRAPIAPKSVRPADLAKTVARSANVRMNRIATRGRGSASAGRRGTGDTGDPSGHNEKELV